ncbi:MAG: hypothetical protein V1827_04145 [Candidatus Micrarchaeota archaeon]
MAELQKIQSPIARLNEERRKALAPLKLLQREHIQANGTPDPELSSKINDLNQAFFDVLKGMRASAGWTSPFSKQPASFGVAHPEWQENLLPKDSRWVKPKKTLGEIEGGEVSKADSAKLWNRLLEGDF